MFTWYPFIQKGKILFAFLALALEYDRSFRCLRRLHCARSLSCSYDRCTTSPQVAVMERAVEHTLRCSDPDVEHALRCLNPEVHMRTAEQHCWVPSIEVGSVRRCIDCEVWHRDIQPIVRGVHQCTHWGVHHDCIYTTPRSWKCTRRHWLKTQQHIGDGRWSLMGRSPIRDTCSWCSTSSKVKE